MGKSLRAASPVVAYIPLSPPWSESLYNHRCELISFLLIRVLQNLLAKNARRLTLFVDKCNINNNYKIIDMLSYYNSNKTR